MSMVTTVMLNVPHADHERLAEFNDAVEVIFAVTHRGTGLFRETSDYPAAWGGWKYPELNMWAGAFNMLDLDGLLLRVHEFDWHTPDEVQVFVSAQDQNDDARWHLAYGAVPMQCQCGKPFFTMLTHRVMPAKCDPDGDPVSCPIADRCEDYPACGHEDPRDG